MSRTSVLFLAALLSASLLPAEDLTLEQAKANFTNADKALNQAYTKAKGTLPEHLFSDLQQDQRGWIDYRDYRSEQAAAFDGGAAEGQEKTTVEYWSSLAAITEERVRIIEGWTKHETFTHEWEGVWSDGEGGLLAILQNTEGGFAFSLDVVRGPTYHIGHIGGSARWNGSTARFSIPALDEEGETWLTFLKRGVKLEIIGENTSSFHGARAYFEGEYIRVAELTDEDRKAILSPEN
jgi:uncharacterized protein YecT (DUF1311 family)